MKIPETNFYSEMLTKPIYTEKMSYPKVVKSPSYMSVLMSRQLPTIRFYLNHHKRRVNMIPVYAMVIYLRHKVEFSLGLSVTADEWDNNNGQLLNKNKHMQAHRKMIELESEIFRILDDRQARGLPVSAKIIKKIKDGKMPIDSPEGAVYMLMPFLQSHIEIIVKNKSEYTPGTVQHYRTLKGHLEIFLNLQEKTDFPLHLIDTAFLKQLDDHFLTWIHPKLKRAMNRNSANKYHSKMRAALYNAKLKKIIQENPYENFPLKRITPKSDFLLDQEIIKIAQHRFNSKSLELTRDYLLFSLWTGGLRFSDLKGLKTHNIFEENGFYFLHLPGQKKTDNSVHTPLLPGAVAIFKKYASHQTETGFILPPLSQQKLNEYLKTIGDLAGVFKRMTHKISRHSCGTTICSRNGVPRHITAAWLGHKLQTRTTDIYAQLTKEESFFWLRKLNEIYNKPEFISK